MSPSPMEKKFYDYRCACPPLADLWGLVKELDACAAGATVYAHRYVDNLEAMQRDHVFMGLFNEAMSRWAEAIEQYRALFAAKVKEGVVVLRWNDRAVSLEELMDAPPEEDTKYTRHCATCGTVIPHIDYSHWGWKF